MGIEVFERAAEARGRLLRVEQLVAADVEPDPQCGVGFLITLDVGRILVAADRTHAGLLIRHIESAAEVESIQRVPLDEAEPWWRVAGNPITRVWPGGAGEGAESGAGVLREVRLQLREDDENPKVISLRYESGAVRVAEEGADGR